jgi:hypothetical protein
VTKKHEDGVCSWCISQSLISLLRQTLTKEQVERIVIMKNSVQATVRYGGEVSETVEDEGRDAHTWLGRRKLRCFRDDSAGILEAGLRGYVVTSIRCNRSTS